MKFRNLTAEPESGLAYRFSVLAVNTEGTTNANNVSFEVSDETGRQEFCQQFLSLKQFERRTVECRAELPAPGTYTLVFQSERLNFTTGEVSPRPTEVPATPATSTPTQPGFTAGLAAAALALGFLLGRSRTRR